MFFLYASTPGWLNGLTSKIYALIAQAFSKKYINCPMLYSFRSSISITQVGTPPSICAFKVPLYACLLI